MNATKKILCMRCKQKVVAHWSGIHGRRFLFDKNGKKFYKATCPQCGNKWNVLKRDAEIIRTHTRDGRLASWPPQILPMSERCAANGQL